MEQDQITVTCPRCQKPFEIDEAYRGSLADCPSCGAAVAIPSTDAEAAFTVRCPSCSTEFEVPESYRGEQAECCECQAVFLIPEHGSNGVPIAAVDATPKPASASAPTPAAPSAPSIAPPVQPEYTSSGIQKTPGTRPKQDTRTVTLSRSAVIENTMKQQKREDLPPGALRQSRPAPVDDEVPPLDMPNFGMAGDSAAASLLSSKIIMPPSFRGREEMRPNLSFKKTTTEPAASAKPVAAPEPENDDAGIAAEPEPPQAAAPQAAPGVTTSADAREAAALAAVGMAMASPAAGLPGWLAHVKLREGEQIRGFKASRPAGGGAYIALAALPIILIPLATLASAPLGIMPSAVIFLVIGAIAGGVTLKKVHRLMTTRKALVLTSERAILVDGETVLDTDLHPRG